jgi:hypothetical protein
LNEHWHGKALRFSKDYGLNFALRRREHLAAAAAMPHGQTIFSFRTCRRSSDGQKSHEPAELGLDAPFSVESQRWLFVRLKEGMAL